MVPWGGVEATRGVAAGQRSPCWKKPHILASFGRESKELAGQVDLVCQRWRATWRSGRARRPGAAGRAATAPRPFQARNRARTDGSAALGASARKRSRNASSLRSWAPSVCAIGLPDERSAGPLRAHERVFAANEVEVARPQQVVVVALGEERQCRRTQAAASAGGAERRGDLVGGKSGRGKQQGRFDGKAVEQSVEPVVLVAEQADHALAGIGSAIEAARAQPGCSVEALLPFEQVGLAQQAAGPRREAGIEEPPTQAGGRAVELRRRQAVAALDVVFGAEVLDVDPDRWALARQPRDIGPTAGRSRTFRRRRRQRCRRRPRPASLRPRHRLRRRVPSSRARADRRDGSGPSRRAQQGRPPGASRRRRRRDGRRPCRTRPSASTDYWRRRRQGLGLKAHGTIFGR